MFLWKRIGFLFCDRSSKTLALEFKPVAEVILEDVFLGIFLFAYDEEFVEGQSGEDTFCGFACTVVWGSVVRLSLRVVGSGGGGHHRGLVSSHQM